MTTFVMPKLYNVGDIDEPAEEAADSAQVNLPEQNMQARDEAGKVTPPDAP